MAIDCAHLSFTAEGLRLLIPRSKGDAAGEGATIGIVRGTRPGTCPVCALEAWLEASACRYGPVFRKVDRWGTVEHRALTPEAVGSMLKRPLRPGRPRPAPRPVLSSGSRRIGCERASSPRPTGPGRGTRRSWRITGASNNLGEKDE